MTTNNIWEPEAAWAECGSWMKTFLQLLCADDSKRVQGPNPHNVNLAPRMQSFLT